MHIAHRQRVFCGRASKETTRCKAVSRSDRFPVPDAERRAARSTRADAHSCKDATSLWIASRKTISWWSVSSQIQCTCTNNVFNVFASNKCLVKRYKILFERFASPQMFEVGTLEELKNRDGVWMYALLLLEESQKLALSSPARSSCFGCTHNAWLATAHKIQYSFQYKAEMFVFRVNGVELRGSL